MDSRVSEKPDQAVTKNLACWESVDLGLVVLEREMRPELAKEIADYIEYLQEELRKLRKRQSDDLLASLRR